MLCHSAHSATQYCKSTALCVHDYLAHYKLYIGGECEQETWTQRATTPRTLPGTLLKTTVQQQILLQQLAQGFQTVTQELMQTQQRGGRDVPLPDPLKEAQHLLFKLTPHYDYKAYLQTFEQTAELKGWLKCEWSPILVPLLLGEAHKAYFALPADDAEDNNLLKSEILARCGLSNTQAPLNSFGSLIQDCHLLVTTGMTVHRRSF